MRNIAPLDRLKTTLQSEREAVLKRQEMYRTLTDKMMAYQNATGPAPTVEEFEQWRAVIDEAVRLRKLLVE